MEIFSVVLFTELRGVKVTTREVIVAKGIRATRKQAAAGRHNALKAQVSRIGLRGQKYLRRRYG